MGPKRKEPDDREARLAYQQALIRELKIAPPADSSARVLCVVCSQALAYSSLTRHVMSKVHHDNRGTYVSGLGHWVRISVATKTNSGRERNLVHPSQWQ